MAKGDTRIPDVLSWACGRIIEPLVSTLCAEVLCDASDPLLFACLSASLSSLTSPNSQTNLLVTESTIRGTYISPIFWMLYLVRFLKFSVIRQYLPLITQVRHCKSAQHDPFSLSPALYFPPSTGGGRERRREGE